MACIFALLIKHEAPSKQNLLPGNSKRPTTVLVTGVGMTKGLFLCRSMYIGGCTVIAADFGKRGNFHCGRFSKAVKRYYALKDPATYGIKAYVTQMIQLINDENIDIWISCSGVATAVEDAELAEKVEQHTRCKSFQLNKDVVSMLDNKLKFMHMTTKFGLSNMEWYDLLSMNDVKSVIISLRSAVSRQRIKKFIVKSAGMDDATRGALPILSTDNIGEVSTTLSNLSFEKGQNWVLQEFIDSKEEYCTQAVVVRGQVKAFTACRSESVLMHYSQLATDSYLFKVMLNFTQAYVQNLKAISGSLTGHISFDFMVKYDQIDGGATATLVPIECNPRCHTATVLFSGQEAKLAKCYLEAIHYDLDNPNILLGDPSHPGYYWIAHDLVACTLAPTIDLFRKFGVKSFVSAVQSLTTVFEHILTWKDPTFELWDPLPWLALNHLYWPSELAIASLQGVRWRQINVSTTKIFKY